MNYFDMLFFSVGKSEAVKSVKMFHFAHHSLPWKFSYRWAIYYQFNKEAVNFDMQRWTADTDCSFAVKF